LKDRLKKFNLCFLLFWPSFYTPIDFSEPFLAALMISGERPIYNNQVRILKTKLIKLEPGNLKPENLRSGNTGCSGFKE
jgi:hypothetical protein